jgi:hypothetical protein
MREFLKPTLTKIVTSVIFLFFGYLISFLWPFLSFYKYLCVPVIDMSGRASCYSVGFDWPKFLLAIILTYILASLMALMPKKILKLLVGAILITIIVGFIILFIGGIKF